VDFFFSNRSMFYTSWNDKHLSFFQDLSLTFQFYFKGAFDNQKEFIFVLVIMPNEFAFYLGDFNGLAIEFSYEPWRPVVNC